ncbi:MAG: hypothetical protein ABJA37_04540 [Ferruginibacter sp.]
MQVLKNIQFTRLFKVAGYLKEFNFRKSNATPEGRFSLDTIDERGNRIVFWMEKAEGGWRIAHNALLPQWVLEQENNLDEAIMEEMKG